MKPFVELALAPAYQPRHALPERKPGMALAAEAPQLLRGAREPAPPDDDVVARVLDALRRWRP